jgi:hypothetical protein
MDAKHSPRLRVGYGQGFVQEQEAPNLVLRLRTGQQLSRGSYIGGETQPLAFVWKDEEVAVPERELVVSVDYCEIYLWDRGRPVRLEDLFPKERGLIKLANRFADWQGYFEKYCDITKPQKFWWGRFHEEGVSLARQLQAALIDQAVIRYFRPVEDQQYHDAPEIAL